MIFLGGYDDHESATPGISRQTGCLAFIYPAESEDLLAKLGTVDLTHPSPHRAVGVNIDGDTLPVGYPAPSREATSKVPGQLASGTEHMHSGGPCWPPRLSDGVTSL